MRTTASPARRILTALARNSRGARAAREAERLSRLPDDELARLGIRREAIVLHAFRELLGS